MKPLIRAILIITLATGTLPAQVYHPGAGNNQAKPQRPEADPFAQSAARHAENQEEEDGPPPPTISVCCETFSLDLTTAATLQREGLGDSALYARLVAMTGKKDARQESLTVIRTVCANKVKSDSVAEVIYATEFEPPELPNTVGVSIVPPKGGPEDKSPPAVPDAGKLENAPALEDLPALQTPAMPSAWATRDTGITLEAEATPTDGGVIGLNLLIQRVTRTGDSEVGQGLSKCTMPDFDRQSLGCSLVVRPGQPAFAGTFNRPPDSKAAPDSANRVWFAFVTVNPVKP
jgi:hypothetical protein